MDMAGFNNELIYESNTYNIQSNQGHSMDPNYTNSLPWDQMHGTDPNYANRFPPDQIISTALLTANHSNQPPSQASLQPPSQAFSFSNTRPLDHNSICLGVNEPLNYRYVENNENRVNYLTRNHNLNNHREPSIRCPISQISGQTQSTTTFSSSASMITIATSHGQSIITINGDINVERLLSVIQSCERVERIYR